MKIGSASTTLVIQYWTMQSGGGGGSGHLMMKKLVFDCNKIDTLEGSIEIASATALAIYERTYLYI